MRHRLAAIAAALLACATSAAQAGTFTIDFATLAADAGQTVTTTMQKGPFFVNVNQSLVIGPGDPRYAGQIGILPVRDQFAVVIDYATGSSVGNYFSLDSISADFAAADGSIIRWEGRQDVDEGGPLWQWKGTAPATMVYTPDPAPESINRIWLQSFGSGDAQLLSLTIVADLAAGGVPEPSAALLGGLGLGTIALAAARRRWLTGTSGSCRASR